MPKQLMALPYGLSPRGRGKLRPKSLNQFKVGSIPAWAGETSVCRQSRANAGVYPRVGGGNPLRRPAIRTRAGLSPRGRGKLTLGSAVIAALGSIPAWAGETHANAYIYYALRVYPRVGGGNNIGKWTQWGCRGLSPRGRGKPMPILGDAMATRSIPAWAGETAADDRCRNRAAVYPRVGGGNPYAASARW